MKKRLKDYTIENRKSRSNGITQVLPIIFEDNDATRRIVKHVVRRVIRQHQEEIQALAYK
ncbi:hypothetical protein J7554_09720 [Wohlfahrtiimonas chitiniclastica]|uniref:hypothetical protein n=1 Tax=Wohlfahrtiimonas chitiniclastica TaxID=400946 RepID=UPI0009EEEDE1|nr:hypothetical protein [Wohlfahrtiimonas chitiniclastica]MBS7829398.1 hypothetical protein [Wohlfahrtiimonas chitiniclastica]